MLQRLLCLLVGYLCGGFLTAELWPGPHRQKRRRLAPETPAWPIWPTSWERAGGRWCWPETSPRPPWPLGCAGRSSPPWAALSGLWAGLGAVLGHNFPLWRGFRGGKGVAVTCAALILFSPLWGTAACLSGLAVTLLSGCAPGGGGDPRPVCPPGLSLPRPGGRAAGPDSGPDHALPAHPGAGPHPPGGGGAKIPRPLSPSRKI